MGAELKLVTSHGLSGVWEAFLDEQAYRGNSKQTLGWYRKVFGLLSSFGINTLEDLSRPKLMAWVADCRHRELSPATIANYDRAVRVAVGWLSSNGYIPSNPLKGLPRPKDRVEQVQPFSQDEINRILEVAKRSGNNPKRHTALVLLLLDTGIRSGEARNLGLRDIDWVEGLLKVNGKTGERVVPFGQKAKRAMQAYIDRERKGKPTESHVFLAGSAPFTADNFNICITRLVRQSGVTRDKVGPHSFRHTFAVEFLRAGGNVFVLQRILGHSRLETTQRYVNLLTDDVKQAHQRYSPVDRLRF